MLRSYFALLCEWWYLGTSSALANTGQKHCTSGSCLMLRSRSKVLLLLSPFPQLPYGVCGSKMLSIRPFCTFIVQDEEEKPTQAAVFFFWPHCFVLGFAATDEDGYYVGLARSVCQKPYIRMPPAPSLCGMLLCWPWRVHYSQQLPHPPPPFMHFSLQTSPSTPTCNFFDTLVF
jgi:hypothetical protein